MPVNLKEAFKLLVTAKGVQQVKSSELTDHEKSVEYDKILDILKEEFQSKYDNVSPSSVGKLDGFETVAIIGVGSFGKVKLCREVETNQFVAVKFLLKEHLVKQKQIQHVINEKRVLASVNFPFLVSLVFSRKNNDYVLLGMPFYNGGELFAYHRKVKKFKENQAIFYASQVFLGLEYMHHVGLIYRDLKPENILLTQNGYIRITDFGFTKKLKDRTLTLCGTPEYLAPELIQAKPYGRSVDWWAFGIFVYELVAGYSPFSEYSHDVMQMYSKICECQYIMPSTFSRGLTNLVKNLLQVDITHRLGNMKNGNKDIKNHEWFGTVNWFAILTQDFKAPFVPVISRPNDITYFEKYPNTPDANSNFNKYADHFEDF